MDVHLTIPWRPDEDLGKAYNAAFARLPDYVIGCVMDYDAMLTTTSWYLQVLKTFIEHRDCGLAVAVTNRIGNRVQRCKQAPTGHNMLDHRAFGKVLSWQNQEVQDITDDYFDGDGDLAGGVFMATPCAVWKELRFPELGKKLGVDNGYHIRVRDAGMRVLVMKNLYVYHWYRA